jgi:hypothetical protein
MTSIPRSQPLHSDAVLHDSRDRELVAETITRPLPARLRWGAVLAGTVAALGLWILLYALGVALGLSTVEPGDDGSVQTSGIVTGVWGIVAPLIALFVGGLVAGRVAGPATKLTGALHGLVMWGITAIGGVWVLGMVVSGVATGAVDVSKTAIGAMDEGFILNVTDAVAAPNERLAAAGAPLISANDVRAASQDVVRDAVRTGRLDKAMMATSLAQQTKMTRADAEAVATRIETQFNASMARAKLAAQNAAETTGHVFWGIFAALLAGLLASMGGVLLAVSREQQDRAETMVGVSLHPRREPLGSR